jgi:hypothetical protein
MSKKRKPIGRGRPQEAEAARGGGIETNEQERRTVYAKIIEEPKREPRIVYAKIVDTPQPEPKVVTVKIIEEPKREPQLVHYEIIGEIVDPTQNEPLTVNCCTAFEYVRPFSHKEAP